MMVVVKNRTNDGRKVPLLAAWCATSKLPDLPVPLL